eukprot:gene22507-30768_t
MIDVGEKYLISWRNGSKHLGEIIEIRPLKRIRESSDGNISGREDFDYYVHYINFDRRLDEWVTFDRIDTNSLVPSTELVQDKLSKDSSFKGKKNNKRKLSEEAHPGITTASLGGQNLSRGLDNKEAQLITLEREHEEVTKVKNIPCIVLGKYEIETWYFSPYPDEYAGEEKMYLCEYCLKYMKKYKTLQSHAMKCLNRGPPGVQIYAEGDLSMFEVDGKDHKVYCQNLCLLSKLFLDHKTLYYEVDPFLFYVLCEVDESGRHHVVGYFSKEKQSQENYNLACILTFPPYQRKGYGKFLISVSYELSKRENTTGSPEKPLSDLGRISYRSYWAHVIFNIFADTFVNKSSIKNITINDISKMTGIRVEDIMSTLHALKMIKFWKGQHVISVYSSLIEAHIKQSKKIRLCNSDCLTWQPPEKVGKAHKS